MTSLLVTLALIVTASIAQASDVAKKLANENSVAFMDYKCSLSESASRMIFADADVDVLATGLMLKTRERVLSVRLTARTGTRQSSDLLLFLKRISREESKTNYSFDTKLGAVLAIEEVSSDEGRTQTIKIKITDDSNTAEANETTVVCKATQVGN